MGRFSIPGLAGARATPLYWRSSRQQALIDTVQFAHDHPWPVALISAPIAGAVAGLLIVDSGPLVRVAAGALGATAGVVLTFSVVYAVFWLGAPTRQRDQARERLREADRQRRLLILGAHLERLRDSFHRNIEMGAHTNLSGRIPDESMSSVEDQNWELKEKLETLGFPELIPQLTLEDRERFRTWEGVAEAERDLHALWYAAIFNDERFREAENEQRLDED
jgi:hypothetical protein